MGLVGLMARKTEKETLSPPVSRVWAQKQRAGEEHSAQTTRGRMTATRPRSRTAHRGAANPDDC